MDDLGGIQARVPSPIPENRPYTGKVIDRGKVT
jgi:hypothetical protein